MEHSEFCLLDSAFKSSTPRVIQPDHIKELQYEEEDMDNVVNSPLGSVQPPPGEPAEQGERGTERGEQSAPDLAPYNEDLLLDCVMQVASDFATFREFERYRFDVSDSYCDVPEDDSSDQSDDETMEDIPKDMPIVQGDQQYSFIPMRQLEDKEDVLELLPPYNSARLTVKLANRRSKRPCQPVSPIHDLLSGKPDGALQFTMADLNIITGNFSESHKIGQGGSGSIYRGQLQDGTTVAVKRIQKNVKNVLGIKDAKECQTEADILSKVKHSNLVRLLGFLEDENERILVTEYVTNGNLRQHLDGVPYGIILDMSKRLSIAVDVAQALTYLHDYTEDRPIIHRDIKSSDILITDTFCAKVAAYGDAPATHVPTRIQGTKGYLAPEFWTTHDMNLKSNVYSFGILLVELFTGRAPVEPRRPHAERVIVTWALKNFADGKLKNIVDPKIELTTTNLASLEKIFELAVACLGPSVDHHPNMLDALGALYYIRKNYQDIQLQSNVKEDNNSDVQEGTQQSVKEGILLEVHEAQTKYLDHTDSSNPSLMSTKLLHSSYTKGFESRKAQIINKLEVDSKEERRQAIKILVGKQDQTSILFTNIVPDLFQLKSDETYIEMLQEEIAKLGYISKLLSKGNDFEQKLTKKDETSFFLYFNEKDNLFEFYFKNCESMASIVGVGLEYAKVVLEDGCKVKVQEISKQNWNDAWKNYDSSSSTMKATVPQLLEERMDNILENTQKSLAYIPRGRCLLLDLAKYFILKTTIASFIPKDSVTHTNTTNGSSSSSSPSSQSTTGSSSNSDQKFLELFQVVKNIFSSGDVLDQLKTTNGRGTPMDFPSDYGMKNATTVHLQLLPGGCLFDGEHLLDATNSDDKTLERWTSQLDNTIYSEIMFTFVNEDDRKEIQVIVGPISFQFQEENEDNYQKTGRFGWFHKLLDVSFGVVDASYSELGTNCSALDVVKVKKSKTIGSTDATTHGTSKTMNGGIQGSIPHTLTLSGGGSYGWSTSKSISDNVGENIEKVFEETQGGFTITKKAYRISSTLRYTYLAPDHTIELDHIKLSNEDYRKYVHDSLPICIPQDVKFQGTWRPKDLEHDPRILVEYILKASRVVQMTSKKISKEAVKKSWISRFKHFNVQGERNDPLKFTQKNVRNLFLNHAMTHLNGKTFKVQERMNQRPLNQMEPETYIAEQYSCNVPQWGGNPLVRLNSEIEHQP